MAISITKIPFFQPMDRDRHYSSALNKVLWALYDVGIDGVFPPHLLRNVITFMKMD